MCLFETLIMLLLLCGIGFFLGSMNGIAVMVIFFYHLYVNIIPYVLFMLFYFLLKKKGFFDKESRKNKAGKTADGSVSTQMSDNR